MRVVFTCVPQAGHVTPLLPLAEAFDRGGDEVLFVSGVDAARAVTARGLGFREAGPPLADWFGALSARTRGVPGDGLPPERVERYFLPRLFGEVGAPLMVDDVLATCRDVRPDLLVFDPLTFAGPLVAATLGVPSVQHTVGPLVDDEVLALVSDAVTPMWREFGLETPADAGVHDGTTLTICPPSLDPGAEGRDRIELLRPVALPDPITEDLASLPPGDEPLVYLTLGTFSNNPQVFRDVIDALVDEPVRVLVTVGSDVDPQTISPTRTSVRVERFVPQAKVLPRCRAVVHHAGAGTAFGTLAHGLPAVALPQSADNFTIAARLGATGAAVVLMPDEVNRDALRSALHEVLTDDRHRAAAAALADEIASMPSPDAVADLLRTRHV